ncbi:hypothetical protein [Halorussus sp. AFM4]|uniref:hypothetical protein n=1 Tax=Halorussus sp. AFM4 TaxID=3421651 RepID=UPI003EB6B908
MEAVIAKETEASSGGRYHLLNEAETASLCGSINAESQFAADVHRRLSPAAAERRGLTLCGRCSHIAGQRAAATPEASE